MGAVGDAHADPPALPHERRSRDRLRELMRLVRDRGAIRAVHQNAELVGLIFDGNIQSLVGNFVYEETQNRAVSVDSRAMIEALRKLYGAAEVANELMK